MRDVDVVDARLQGLHDRLPKRLRLSLVDQSAVDTENGKRPADRIRECRGAGDGRTRWCCRVRVRNRDRRDLIERIVRIVRADLRREEGTWRNEREAEAWVEPRAFAVH